MNEQPQPVERVIGFDAHPHSFTAAIVQGPTPAAAVVVKIFNKIPMGQLQNWTKKHTTEQDMIVLEASGNSFQIARTVAGHGRKPKVLESCQMGKLKEAHANNDKISAVRIAKAYLAGTAKEVWVPDEKTQERRDWFHAHRKAVKRTSQVNTRLQSYLSDNGVILDYKGDDLQHLQEQIKQQNTWTPRQLQVIDGLLLERRHAEEQREHWRSLIAQEVLADPQLLSIVRLCGVRELVAFSLGAIIGDIHRFSSPKKLVKYVGLNPAFDSSGENEWTGGIGGHGRSDLRALLIEAAHSILRSHSDLAKWGKKLLARRGEIKLVVAAVARKLTVAVWYLLMGRWTPIEEIDARLEIKVSKIISRVGAKGLKALGKDRKTYRQEVHERLKTGREYVLEPNKKYESKAPGQSQRVPVPSSS